MKTKCITERKQKAEEKGKKVELTEIKSRYNKKQMSNEIQC